MLDQVSLRLEPGTLTEIRGENGSGKSTLLRLACGFSPPSAGSVQRGFDTLGYVPDRASPAPTMTASSYLDHLGRMAGQSTRATRLSAGTLADRLGLAPGLDEPLGTLSRGNLRKVLLVQCLMRPVDLVVMDEPLAALDDAASNELAALVRDRLDLGCAFLIATHDHGFESLGRTLQLQSGGLLDAPTTGRGAAAEFIIELDEPLGTSGLPGTLLPDGSARYLVPSDQVERFLQQAIAARLAVLRLNPVEPGPGANAEEER